MTKPTPHPHADLIAEWLKNTSRKLEMRYKGYIEYYEWEKCRLDVLIGSDSKSYEVRFTDKAEQKPKIVSSLTDKELDEVTREDCRSAIGHRRAIANAAAQRVIEELTVPPNAWFHDLFDESEARFAITSVGKYLNALKEGKL